MRHEPYERFEAHGCDIRIEIDEDPLDPREDDNLGTMACWHRRYNLGDEQPKFAASDYLASLCQKIHPDFPDEQFEKHGGAILAKYYVIMPLFLFDHSGITMSTSSAMFRACDSAGWDWGQVGIIYCTLEQAMKNWMIAKAHPDASWDSVMADWDKNGAPTGEKITLRKATERLLEGEVKTYDQFLTGSVYGYVVEGYGEEDSCWGFFGEVDYVKSQAIEAARRIEVSKGIERIKETEVV
jgi:hypothetical protein